MAQNDNILVNALVNIVHQLIRVPVVGLLLLLAITAGTGYYATTHFVVNSERSGLISPQAAFRKNWDELQKEFPMYRQSIVVLIEAPDASQATDAARSLAGALSAEDGLFVSIFAPAAEPFFREHGLLYQSDAELDQTVTDLAAAQPALAGLAYDPSLRGLFRLLDSALEAYQRGEDVSDKMVELMNDVSDVGDAVLNNREGSLDWEAALNGANGKPYQIIILQINEDYTQQLSGRTAITKIKDLAADLGLTADNGIAVSLTGSIPLATEEMETVAQSMGVAGIVSLILLALILGFGIRSVRIIVSILLTLGAGLVWTMAWAMFTVGELNMISASFAVLIVGLGVDFAIHLSLRYHEAIESGVSNKDSLEEAVRGISSAVALAAITSAVGFFSFFPTQYKGIADLGLIAGGGMICAFFAAVTVLPVCLGLMGSRAGRLVGEAFTRRTEFFFHGVSRYAISISVLAAVIGVGAVLVARHTTFDFSTLTLKDGASPALATLKRLQELDVTTDYAVYVLADDRAQGREIAKKLKALDSVKSVELPDDYVPEDQELKLSMIEEVAFSYLPILDSDNKAPPATAADRLQAVQSLEQTLKDTEAKPGGETGGANGGAAGPVEQAASRLARVLFALQAVEDSDAKIAELDTRLVGNIDEPLDFLRKALFVEQFDFSDLPETLQKRLISPDGKVRVVGIPAQDITQFDAMKAFVADVTAVVPNATGRPVLEAGVGELVVSSFRTAIIIALCAITVILFIFVRSIVDTLLILTPLVLAAFLTVATGVLVDIPFNQANIIVLPLIMGLGVDNGIHILLRFREDGSIDQLLRSSTPRAVVLSTLTTIAAFGALALSAHPGIESMGLLLAIAMGFLLICTVAVLPALLYTRLRVVHRTWRAQTPEEIEDAEDALVAGGDVYPADE